MDDKKIESLLKDQYCIKATIDDSDLVGGADINSVVTRLKDNQKNQYLLKIRLGDFDEMSVVVPAFLVKSEISHVISPLLTKNQQPWVRYEDKHIMLYPFIEGKSGTNLRLSEKNWIDFGKAMREIHSITLPKEITSRLKVEKFADTHRLKMERLLDQLETTTHTDYVAVRLTELIHSKRKEIERLIVKAQSYADALKSKTTPQVLCHGDIHVANLIVDTQDYLYLVDWDTLQLAPKERDLMYVGGGIIRRDTEKEIQKFYEGYGDTSIDYLALAYYRIERVIEDIYAFCNQILRKQGSVNELMECLGFITSNFDLHGTIAIAYETEIRIPKN